VCCRRCTHLVEGPCRHGVSGEREPSQRQQRDEWLKKEITRVWEDPSKGQRVYGARKVWLQLQREGMEVARCTVERLMRELGIARAAARHKKPRTRVPAATSARPRRTAAGRLISPTRTRLPGLRIYQLRGIRREDRRHIMMILFLSVPGFVFPGQVHAGTAPS